MSEARSGPPKLHILAFLGSLNNSTNPNRAWHGAVQLRKVLLFERSSL